MRGIGGSGTNTKVVEMQGSRSTSLPDTILVARFSAAPDAPVSGIGDEDQAKSCEFRCHEDARFGGAKRDRIHGMKRGAATDAPPSVKSAEMRKE